MTDKRQELKDRLLRAFEICDKHITRIEEALCGLKPYFPLDEEKYLNLNSEAVMRLDQFIFRFFQVARRYWGKDIQICTGVVV